MAPSETNVESIEGKSAGVGIVRVLKSSIIFDTNMLSNKIMDNHGVVCGRLDDNKRISTVYIK